MFSTPVLDIAIALLFTYFLIAVIVSAVNEAIMAMLNMRSKMLKSTIINLIEDDKWKELAGEMISSPFFSALKKTEDSFPSYVPPNTFVNALKFAADSKDLFKIADGISLGFTDEESSKNKVLKMFEMMAVSAQGNIDTFEKKLEELFNSAMDRLNGWYKKRVQNIIIFISFFIVLALNIDTINIINILWKNPVIAQAAAEGISNMVKENADSTSTIKSLTDSTGNKIDQIKQAFSALKGMPFPVGWQNDTIMTSNAAIGFWGWVSKVFGILLTTLAATLGAPFWFDLLNKAVNLRSAGKKPEPDNADGSQ